MVLADMSQPTMTFAAPTRLARHLGGGHRAPARQGLYSLLAPLTRHIGTWRSTGSASAGVDAEMP